MLRRAFKVAKTILLTLLMILVAVEIYTLIIVHTEGNADLPATFGNFGQVRASLVNADEREDFSFAVVGDTRNGTEIFEGICEKLRAEPLSFMVLLGDCVRDGTAGYHAFLRCEWAKELAMPFPVFYVVGNHDVDREKFPVSQFEKIYGPTNFWFNYSGCLFIVLRILNEPYSTKESLEFLDTVLTAQRNNYDRTFVFMHIPPPVSSNFRARNFVNAEKLVTLFDRYRVEYVIAGDYHGYAREKVKNTVYLVTGGGGAHLRKAKFGRFHHAIVIKVGPNRVSERILPHSSMVNLEDRLEELAFGEIHPRLKDNWAVTIILNAGILGILFWSFRKLLRNHR